MRATAVKSAGSWNGEAADSIVLDYDDRHRRRMARRRAQTSAKSRQNQRSRKRHDGQRDHDFE